MKKMPLIIDVNICLTRKLAQVKTDLGEGVLAGPAAVLGDLNQLTHGSERETQKHPHPIQHKNKNKKKK